MISQYYAFALMIMDSMSIFWDWLITPLPLTALFDPLRLFGITDFDLWGQLGFSTAIPWYLQGFGAITFRPMYLVFSGGFASLIALRIGKWLLDWFF